MKETLLLALFAPCIIFGQSPQIENFKITILSTMLSDTHIGE
jgi:hypothetical protein